MPLICNNPSKIILRYTSVIPNKIRYSGRNYTSWSTRMQFLPRTDDNARGVFNFFDISANNPEQEITWEFKLDLVQSWYRYPLTVTRAGTQDDPKSVTFDVFFPGMFQDIGFWFDESGFVRWMLGELPEPETTATVYPGYYKVDSPVEGSGGIPGTSLSKILDISIGSGVIHDELGYAWDLIVNLDGEHYVTRRVRSNTSTPPFDEVFIIDGQPGELKEEEFLFHEFSENGNIPNIVKLKKEENLDYSWQLIKNYSIDNSEDSDIKIKQFYGIEPEILCFVGEGKCPDNTCEVDCISHVCCYQSNGVSVFHYSK